jgi:hypothetical protein
MLEAQHFIILIEHKPLTFAFHQKRDKCSPCQFNHLDFISQFTTVPETSTAVHKSNKASSDI